MLYHFSCCIFRVSLENIVKIISIDIYFRSVSSVIIYFIGRKEIYDSMHLSIFMAI